MNSERSSLAFFTGRHALPCFFGMAFLISWVFWFVEPMVRGSDPLAAGLLVKIGTYGPVLAAVLVSALAQPERVSAPLRLRWLIAGLVLALAIYVNWSTASQLRSSHGPLLDWCLLTIIVLLPGWVFFNAHSRLCGVQELLKSLTRWRTHPVWFVVALLLMLVLSLAGVLITALLTSQTLEGLLTAIRSSQTLQHLGLTFIATALYGGPLGEEGGWRGFALPRLQGRFDPLLASVVLAALWGLWHLPLHLTGYYSSVYGNPLNGILQQMLSTFPLAVIFTWLYNRSQGNLLIMVLLHTAINVTSGIVAPAVGLIVTTVLAVVGMILVDRMYRKTPADQPGNTSPEHPFLPKLRNHPAHRGAKKWQARLGAKALLCLMFRQAFLSVGRVFGLGLGEQIIVVPQPFAAGGGVP
jgi:membrane protease YdiL (CAAX protease family)